MRKLVVVLLILSVIAIGLFISQLRNEKEEGTSLVPTGAFPSQIPSAIITPIPTGVVVKNIMVSSPINNQQVSGSFTVTGEARVFENVVSIRVTDETSGKVLTQTTAYASAADVGQFGPFALRFDIPREIQSGNKLLVEVYQASPKDESEIDKTVITVQVK